MEVPDASLTEDQTAGGIRLNEGIMRTLDADRETSL